MSINKDKVNTLVLRQRVRSNEANDLLTKFLINGHIIHPSDLDLPSFEREIIEHESFEQAGEENQLLMYSAQRYISNKKELIPVEVKIYFFANQVATNGLGIFGNIRLHAFLEKSSSTLKENGISLQMYFSNSLREGAIVFSNGVVMRFSDKNNKLKTFYITTLESNSNGNEIFSFQKASLASVRLLYKKHTYENMKNRRYHRKPAISKLLKALSKWSRPHGQE